MVPALGGQGARAAGVAKAQGSAGGELADGGAAPRRPHARWQGKEQDVVLAGAQGELDGIDAERCAEVAGSRRQRQAVAVEHGADAALAAEAMEVEGDAVGDIDGGGASAAPEPASELELGTRLAVSGHRLSGSHAKGARQASEDRIIVVELLA